MDHAYVIFDNPTNLGFFGWDERLGAGFENPNCIENQNAYRMVAIGAWKHFAAVLEDLGEKELAEKYLQYAKTKTEEFTSDPLFYTKLGIHASADAINAGLISDLSLLYHEDFSDRLNRLSYSPFNQYFLLEAMASAGSGKLGVYYSNGNVACDQTFTVDIKLNQKQDYTVILYFADCDDGGREQCVEMFDGNTLNLIAPIAAVRDFEGGVYLIYSYNDSVRFRIDHIRGDNAVLSAIFFGLGGGDPTQTTSEIVDDQSSAVHYTGNWTHDPMGSAYNGTFSYSNVTGNSATFTFEGKSIAFLSSLESNRGIVEILLDGVSQGEFDLYSASTARQQIIFSKNDLSEGSHTIEIRVTGKKNRNPQIIPRYSEKENLRVC
ncbi:MAG: hypothetical protein ACI3YK_04760, partial [Eubacteriales bacterium]